MRFWPRTLGAQLIVRHGSGGAGLQCRRGGVVRDEPRAHERNAPSTNACWIAPFPPPRFSARSPPSSANAPLHSMDSPAWRFQTAARKPEIVPMPPANKPCADRAHAMLPEERAKQPVIVKIATREAAQARRAVAIAALSSWSPLPVVRGTQLVTTFYRPPSPPMADRNFIAALAAIITTSAGGGLYRAARGAAVVATCPPPRDSSARRRCPARARRRAGRCAPCGRRLQRHDRSGDAHAGEPAPIAFGRGPRSAHAHHRHAHQHRIRRTMPNCASACESNLDELQELTEAVLSAAQGAGWGTQAQCRSCRADRKPLRRSGRHGQTGDMAPMRRSTPQLPPERNPPRHAQPDRERHRLWQARACLHQRCRQRLRRDGRRRRPRHSGSRPASACSNRSCGWNPRATPKPAARAWGLRSSRPSSRAMAAASRSKTAPRAACGCAFICLSPRPARKLQPCNSDLFPSPRPKARCSPIRAARADACSARAACSTAEDIAALQESGASARSSSRGLKHGDIEENEAARRIAALLPGANVRANAAFTGPRKSLRDRIRHSGYRRRPHRRAQRHP